MNKRWNFRRAALERIWFRAWQIVTEECRRVLYLGRVQGVGFRATARQLARGFDVRGHVRNLPDGGVELLAQGHLASVASFLAAVRREFQHRIQSERIQSERIQSEPLQEHLSPGFSILG